LQKALDAVDWAKLDAMTDEQIEAAALSDPDNPPLTDEQIKRLRLIRKTRRGPDAAE
jgi:putative transcriptional regulator